MSRAHITSIEALERFRATLAEFADDARDALCAVEGDIHRAEVWLQEQGKHWQREIRKRQEDVNRAKNELASRKYQNRDGRGLGSTEQEKALKKALARLEEAETKLANCKRWAPEFHRAVHEYHGPARMLSGVLDTDVVNALALLANKLAALEAYLNIAPPSAPVVSVPTDEPEMTTAAMPVAEVPPPGKEETPS